MPALPKAPRSVVFCAPEPAAGHCQPTCPPETPGPSQVSLAQYLVGSLLLSPGSWCAQGFVCVLQESVSPVLWKFCNQIPLGFKVKFPGGSLSLCWIPRLGNLLWALELLQQCEDFFGVIVLVCGSSARCLCGGANGDFLQEDLGHTPRHPGLLQPEPLSFWQATADSCLRRRHSNTRRQVWPSLLMG